MEKRIKYSFVFAFLFLLSVGFASATKSCTLDMVMLNQDPYPAVPGENVDVIFQITGVQSIDCGKVSVRLNGKFPFNVAPSNPNYRSIESGTFLRGYENFWLVPYTLKVDENSPEGNNKAEFTLSSRNEDYQVIKEFNINVQEVGTDFEVFIRDYDFSLNRITFEILNIGKNNIEALTIEIPRQENIQVKGANRNIVGFLDSNDFTTANFEAIPSEGKIDLNIYYTDTINNRRSVSKTVFFEQDYFQGRLRDQKKTSSWFYIAIILIPLLIIYYFYNKRQKAKKKKHLFGNIK